MKRLIIPVATIFLLQVIVGWICLKTIVSDGYPFFEISSLWPVGLISFIALPLIGGKWLSDILNHSIGWKRSIIIYISVNGLILLMAILWSVIHSSRI